MRASQEGGTQSLFVRVMCVSFCLLKDCGSQCLSANPLGGCWRFGISRHPQAAARDLQASNQLFAAKSAFLADRSEKQGPGIDFLKAIGLPELAQDVVVRLRLRATTCAFLASGKGLTGMYVRSEV